MSPHPLDLARLRTYVALGDSFTEGVGDPDPSRPNGVRGWADRVALELSRHSPDLRYANLAIRGRKMAGVLSQQVEPALAMRPDLVSIYAGGNDILRPVVDVDAMVAAYADSLRRLRTSGAHVVLFTGFDLGWAPVFGRLRGRVAIYNELVREVADELDATLVDFWRMRHYRHSSMWDADRTHMSALGHEHMATAVLEALGATHDIDPAAPEEVAPLPPSARRRQDLAWARTHAGPWLHRRLTGRSSGDTVRPRFPSPVAARELATRSGTI